MSYGSSVLQPPASAVLRQAMYQELDIVHEAEERANDEKAAEFTSLQAKYDRLQAGVTSLSLSFRSHSFFRHRCPASGSPWKTMSTSFTRCTFPPLPSSALLSNMTAISAEDINALNFFADAIQRRIKSLRKTKVNFVGSRTGIVYRLNACSRLQKQLAQVQRALEAESHVQLSWYGSRFIPSNTTSKCQSRSALSSQPCADAVEDSLEYSTSTSIDLTLRVLSCWNITPGPDFLQSPHLLLGVQGAETSEECPPFEAEPRDKEMRMEKVEWDGGFS